MLTDQDAPVGGGEEVQPPFLLEETQFVRGRSQESVVERIRTLADSQRLSVGPFIALAAVTALVVLYVTRPDAGEAPAPALNDLPAAPSTAADEGSVDTSTRQLNLGDLAGVPATEPGGNGTVTAPLPPTTATTRPPATTPAPTTASTTTTTTAPTTTTTVPTTTTTFLTTLTLPTSITITLPTVTSTLPPDTKPEPSIIPLSDCEIEIRGGSRFYAEPTTESAVVGGTIFRVDARARALALTDEGAWYQISNGWVSENRVRDTEGNCG